MTRPITFSSANMPGLWTTTICRHVPLEFLRQRDNHGANGTVINNTDTTLVTPSACVFNDCLYLFWVPANSSAIYFSRTNAPDRPPNPGNPDANSPPWPVGRPINNIDSTPASLASCVFSEPNFPVLERRTTLQTKYTTRRRGMDKTGRLAPQSTGRIRHRNPSPKEFFKIRPLSSGRRIIRRIAFSQAHLRGRFSAQHQVWLQLRQRICDACRSCCEMSVRLDLSRRGKYGNYWNCRSYHGKRGPNSTESEIACGP
jgi:hypothetical protein